MSMFEKHYRFISCPVDSMIQAHIEGRINYKPVKRISLPYRLFKRIRKCESI